uniref:Disco-interacting protein 2 homolog C-like n=1 Tax=Sinocyclocheilus grahami TaxID=75366 RepID=A0A672NJQ6_SINGR
FREPKMVLLWYRYGNDGCFFINFFSGDITQKGYEKKRSKLLQAYLPHTQGAERRIPVTPSSSSSSSSRYQRRRSTGTRDERYRSDVHSEAVQAALERHSERKMTVLLPSKRQSLVGQTSMDTYTPPDSSSGSDAEGSLGRAGGVSVDSWISRALHGSPSTSSSSSSHSNSSANAARLAETSMHSYDSLTAPPDITSYMPDPAPISVQRPQVTMITRPLPKYGNAELMETGDGVPVSSRVSAKIQQLVNTLKRPKRRPLREFFVEDFEELLEVQQPDPSLPRPEGVESTPIQGEELDGLKNCPASLEAALLRWGAIAPKAPCLTTTHSNAKQPYTLTYGKLWSKSLKLAYNLLHKLGSKQEPIIHPGDRVALVYPNNDPAAFMVAFYGCLLAEVVPVPIEVPLTKKDAGSQQIGFLLGSCGVAVALTSDACHKGLPKSASGDVMQFKGWPKLLWVLTDSKHLSKPPREWFPLIKDANNDTAYIEYKTCKDGSVSHITNDITRPMYIHTFILSFICMHVFSVRPQEGSSKPAGQGVLSMTNLSHGVIRVDTGEKLSVLTLQDVGTAMPGAMVCVVKLEGVPQLCKTDEIGEICVSSVATGTSYYGLSGMSKNTFEVCPVACDGGFVSDCVFVRSGLLGFVGPGGMIFISGTLEGLMQVGGRKHSADDIIATALAVEPMKFIYRGRTVVFSVNVLYDERIVLVAEQRPDSTEEESYQWMSRVLQAIDGIHQVGVYCLALVPANTLPKTPLGGIHLSETKQLFLEGALHPSSILMCPHSCITNLPKPRQKQPGTQVGPASVMVGNLVAGKRMAQASGRDLSHMEDNEQFLFLSEVLQWRAQTTPEHILYTLINSRVTSLTCLQLHKRAEKIATLLYERGQLRDGDHVALVYPPGLDLIAAFYGCLYAGCIPITVRPPHPQNISTTLPTVKMILEVSRSVCVMTTQAISKLLKSRDASVAVDFKSWPPILETDDLPKRRCSLLYKPCDPDTLAYLDFSVSTTGMLAGVKMSHNATSALCRSVKLQCELYPSREVAVCLDPYCGLGFVLWCLCSVYAGQQSVLISPMDLEVNPALWLQSVSQFKVRDTFCSYSVMELCTRSLSSLTDSLKVRAHTLTQNFNLHLVKQHFRLARGMDLTRVRSCVVVAEERPRVALTQSFCKLFKDVGLHPRAVSTAFGCRVNLAVCLQGTSGPDPTTVYVDMRALRHDRVRLVERGSPHSLPLMESGKILPGVRIIIANPETKGPIGDSHLGEIWVHSPQNASGYFTVFGEENVRSDHFGARLSFGDTQTLWARTGYLGFLRRTDLTDANGERHDALYVVGALDEVMELRGMKYHPIDIETSIIRAHRNITECAVFTWTNLLVVVVELDGSEQDALDLVPMVTNVVLEEHYLIVGVVVVVDTGVIPINSRGEKQRMHLRDGFLADQLDPIYVAYNM